MKTILVSSCLLVLLGTNAFGAAKDPEFKMIDGKVSIQAEAVTLKQFLQLLDAATGMTSKVSPALQNEKISVRLEGLDLDAAIRKSFQGQPWNYYVTLGKGITIIDKAALVAPPSGSSSSLPVQPIDTRDNNPPPPVPSAFTQPQPAPAPANTPANAANPAAAPNLPPAQGGPAAPVPLFQAPGTSLGAPLPSATPGR